MSAKTTSGQRAHAAGATHLGKGIIERDIETSRAGQEHGTDSLLRWRLSFSARGRVLQKMGYTNVFSMAGGWQAWQEAGGKTE